MSSHEIPYQHGPELIVTDRDDYIVVEAIVCGETTCERAEDGAVCPHLKVFEANPSGHGGPDYRCSKFGLTSRSGYPLLPAARAAKRCDQCLAACRPISVREQAFCSAYGIILEEAKAALRCSSTSNSLGGDGCEQAECVCVKIAMWSASRISGWSTEERR